VPTATGSGPDLLRLSWRLQEPGPTTELALERDQPAGAGQSSYSRRALSSNERLTSVTGQRELVGEPATGCHGCRDRILN
jgi:hypothetical protein